MPKSPTVSAVIPTRSRPALAVRAVHSALSQTYPVHEVVVVIDGPDEATAKALQAIRDPRLNVLPLPESRRAGGARNAGVQLASGDLIAFLDDDDAWTPDKIARQVASIELLPEPDRSVVSCQAFWHTGRKTLVWPTRAIASHETVGDYLFVRRHAGEGVLATPTLLLPRSVAVDCPLPEHLNTHEEWDWLLQLERTGVTFHTVLTPLVDIDARPRRTSVSNSNSWLTSMSWAMLRADWLGPKAFSGFLLTEVARAAVIQHAGWRATAAIAAAAITGSPTARDMARFLARPLVFKYRNVGAS